MKILLSATLILTLYCSSLVEQNAVSFSSSIESQTLESIDTFNLIQESNSSTLKIFGWLNIHLSNAEECPIVIIQYDDFVIFSLAYYPFKSSFRYQLKSNPSQSIFTSTFMNSSWRFITITIRLRTTLLEENDEVTLLISGNDLGDVVYFNQQHKSKSEFPNQFNQDRLKIGLISQNNLNSHKFLSCSSMTNVKIKLSDEYSYQYFRFNSYFEKNQIFSQKSNKYRLLTSCPSNTFDDGLSCIDSSFYIPMRQNLVTTLPPLGSKREKFYHIPHKWNQEQSFYLGFSVSQLSIIDLVQAISYIREGLIFLFTITAKYQNSSSQHQICFYFKLIELNCFIVDPTFTWIGLWTNFVSVITTIRNLGVEQNNISTISGITNMIDPIICVGTCIVTGIKIFLGQLSSSVTFIKGITQPPSSQSDFTFLNSNPAELYFQFDIEHINLPSQAINMITQFPESSNFKFNFSNISLYHLAGFYFAPSPAGVGGLDNPIQFGKELSYSCSFQIYLLLASQIFFQYTMNTKSIMYSFLIQSTSSFEVQVCIQMSCQSTTNCLLKANTPIFIAIIARNLDEGTLNLINYEFEVVCNYRRNKFQFQAPIINSVYQESSITIAPTNNYSVFNNIRILLGSVFYFDYTPDDPCFIYYDLTNMKCLKAKPGFAIYNGQAVPQNDCINFSEPNKTIFYNQFVGECYLINFSIPSCFNYNYDLSCLSCQDPNTVFNNCIDCVPGYQKSIESGKCIKLICQDKCLECESTESCTVCKNSKASPPDCQCTLTNQYLDQNNLCQDCNPKCLSCEVENICSTCSPNRILPLCNCDTRYYDQQLSTDFECIPIKCSYKCNTCEYTPDNCTICANERINSPSCDCPGSDIEFLNNCKSCDSHYFFNGSECQKCDSNCKECETTSTNCIECYNPTFLKKGNCLCSDFSSFVVNQNGEPSCKEFIDVSFSVEKQKENYLLIFKFDESIDDIDFDLKNINSLIYIYISQVQNKYYNVKESVIQDNYLKLTVEFSTSFKQTTGKIIFLDTQSFKNSENNKELNYKYQTSYLDFQIGPFILTPKGEETPSEFGQSSEGVTSFLNDNKSTSLTFFKQFQVIFYVLNTLQPCVCLLMVQIYLPKNLYLMLKVPALLVFPSIEDTFQVGQKKQYYLIGNELDEAEVSNNQSLVFNRLGFSNCIIVNITITLLQNLIWVIFYTSIVTISAINPTFNFVKTKAFILKKISGNIEVGLLVICASAFNQFLNMNSSQILNRISQYVAVLIVSFLILFNIKLYKMISIEINKNRDISQSIILQILDKLELLNQPQQAKYYFFLQLMKKYILAVILVFLENYPSCVCISVFSLFLFSLIVTLYVRPYKSFIGNLTKLIGESLMATIWMIVLLKFIPFQKYYTSIEVIPERDIIDYLYFGKVVFYILVGYNGIYILELIWNLGIMKIYNCFSAKRKQSVLKIVDLNNQKVSNRDQYNQKLLQYQIKSLQSEKGQRMMPLRKVNKILKVKSFQIQLEQKTN